jgi:hypothetical protein
MTYKIKQKNTNILRALMWKQRNLPLHCIEIFCVELCNQVVRCSSLSRIVGSASTSLFSYYRSHLKLHCTEFSLLPGQVLNSNLYVMCFV